MNRTGYCWSDEEKQILTDSYRFGPDVAFERISAAGYKRSIATIKTKANTMGLKCDPDVMREIRKANAERTMAEKGGRDALFGGRVGPFEALPDEYIKVSSIWRVGARYRAQFGGAA